MNKLTTWKRIGSMFLTLALMLTMMVTALPVYAAGGSISIKYDPDVDLEQATNFELYKVGTFGHDSQGKTTVDLVDELKGSGVNLNIAVPEKEEDMAEGSAWHQSWLTAAGNLDNWMKTPASGKTIPEPVWTGAFKKSADYQKIDKELSNGIYLLSGDEQLVGEQFWAPVPVLIMVLNGETEFEIVNTDLKMATRPLVHKHTVTKTWQDDQYKSGRPASVKVGIYYGSTQMDTVTLSDANNWTYTWYSQNAIDRIYTSKDPENKSAKGVETDKLNEGNSYKLSLPEEDASWRVDEIMPAKYGKDENAYNRDVVVIKSDDTTLEQFRIENTVLTPVTHNPPVLKTIDGGEPDDDATFEFSLTAIETTANVEEMPMPEGSDKNLKIMEAKAGTPEEFGEMVFRVPGTYVYEIKELDTGLENYEYDGSVYRLTYEVTAEGNKLVNHLTVTKNGTVVNLSEYEFINTYIPDEDVPPGTVKTGDDNNIVAPAVAFGIALILLIIFLIKRRKSNDSE